MNPTDPSPRTADVTPSTWVWPLLLVAALLAIVLRVWLPSFGIFNFTVVGALALFTGAKLRSPLAYGLPLVVMAVSDLLLWRIYHYSPFNWVSYFSFLLYVVIGQFVVRSRGVPAIIGGTFAGGMIFFLLSNGMVWWNTSIDPALIPEGRSYVEITQGNQYDHPSIKYARDFWGLCACYTLALPFYRNTVAGDALFVTILFGAHALLTRYVPAGLFARKEQS